MHARNLNDINRRSFISRGAAAVTVAGVGGIWLSTLKQEKPRFEHWREGGHYWYRFNRTMDPETGEPFKCKCDRPMSKKALIINEEFTNALVEFYENERRWGGFA